MYKVTCGGRAGASPEWTVSTAPGVCVCVCSLLCVCVLGWVKYREHISLLVILCIIVYVTKKKRKKKKNLFFSKPISDYGKMLKYREKYRETDISVDLYFFYPAESCSLLIQSFWAAVQSVFTQRHEKRFAAPKHRIHREVVLLFVYRLHIFLHDLTCDS